MADVSVTTASDVQAIFDRIAPVYDSLNYWLSLGQHRVWKAMTVKWSGCQSGDTALDVCCGSGDLTELLAKQVGRSGRVTGLDFSTQQLAIAAQRHQNKGQFLPIQWLQGDALELPFGDRTFDCVTMGYGLRNVTDIPTALTELKRVLKVGKKAAILDFNHPTGWMETFQNWYLDQVVVPTARYFQVTEEYAYIYPSLERFPTGSEQVNLAAKVGFSQAIHYEIAGGLMGVLVVQK
ncbi:MAG: bifunctional demethylmenaquinone methyltransferase/2-methoxy-6-polyprenyl-1,4-benzoquinol methylase UbiE, partial [Microcystaceae cyanobacterium]